MFAVESSMSFLFRQSARACPIPQKQTPRNEALQSKAVPRVYVTTRYRY